MDKVKLLIALSLTSMMIITACTKHSPDAYDASSLQQVNKVDHAVVKSYRMVDVDDPNLALGAIGGGVAGGVGGAQIGQGKGAALAAVGGALAGAAGGALLQHEMSKATAFEYILEKSNGDWVTLAQIQDHPFVPGTHVLVLYGVQARIIPDAPDFSKNVTDKNK